MRKKEGIQPSLRAATRMARGATEECACGKGGGEGVGDGYEAGEEDAGALHLANADAEVEQEQLTSGQAGRKQGSPVGRPRDGERRSG